jgi:hypothetical protein
MVPRLLRRGEVGARIPALGEFLQGGDVDDPVVEVPDDLRHIPFQEGLVRADRVPAQRRLPRFADVPDDVGEDSGGRLLKVQAVLPFLYEPRVRVHRADELVHVRHRGLTRAYEDVDPLVGRPEVRIRHYDGDLDQLVDGCVQARHFTVDPDNGIVHDAVAHRGSLT